jgi:flagellar motor switch protein FliN/FliY
MSLTRQEWVDRFVGDLASAIGAITGGEAAAAPGSELPSAGWTVTLRADAGAHGELFIEFDRSSSQALAKMVMGMDEEPADDIVVDTLREMCAQAAGSMVLEDPLVGTKLSVAAVEPATEPAADAISARVTVDSAMPIPLRIWGDIQLADAPRPAAPVQASAPTASPVPARTSSSSTEASRLEVILDIDLPLTVRFGRTEMPIRLISALGPGSVIDLGRSPDDPVDVLVSNQLVARGEVVIVGGNYGVRITDVFNPENGVRGVEERVR